jgi:hypothetical protein
VSRVILLDSGILSLATQRKGVREADDCRQWIAECVQAGASVRVPAIAHYEARRELLRARKMAAIARLDAFITAEHDRYILLTEPALRLAAELWARTRQQGRPTADPKALDVDVILAAQALTLDVPPGTLVVATTNLRHLSLFVNAQLWTDIQP